MLRAAVHRAASAVADATAPSAAAATPHNAAAALGTPSRGPRQAHGPAPAGSDAETISLISRRARRRRRRAQRSSCGFARAPRIRLPEDESASEDDSSSDPAQGWTHYLTCGLGLGLCGFPLGRRAIHLSDSDDDASLDLEPHASTSAQPADPREGDAQLFDDATIARLNWSLADPTPPASARTSPAPHSPPKQDSASTQGPSPEQDSFPKQDLPQSTLAPPLPLPPDGIAPSPPPQDPATQDPCQSELHSPTLATSQPSQTQAAAAVVAEPDPSDPLALSDHGAADVDALRGQDLDLTPEVHLAAHSVTLDAHSGYANSPLPKTSALPPLPLRQTNSSHTPTSREREPWQPDFNAQQFTPSLASPTSASSHFSSHRSSKSGRRHKTRSKHGDTPKRRKKEKVVSPPISAPRRFLTEAEAEAAAGGFDLNAVPPEEIEERDEFGFTQADLDRAQAQYEAQAEIREMELAQREQALLRGQPHVLSPTYDPPVVHHHYYVAPPEEIDYAPEPQGYVPYEREEFAPDEDYNEQEDHLTHLPDTGIDYENIGVLPQPRDVSVQDQDSPQPSAPLVEPVEGDLAGLGFSSAPKERYRAKGGGSSSSSRKSSRKDTGRYLVPSSGQSGGSDPRPRHRRNFSHTSASLSSSSIRESGTALSSALSASGGASGGGSQPTSTQSQSHRYPRLAAAQQRRKSRAGSETSQQELRKSEDRDPSVDGTRIQGGYREVG